MKFFERQKNTRKRAGNVARRRKSRISTIKTEYSFERWKFALFDFLKLSMEHISITKMNPLQIRESSRRKKGGSCTDKAKKLERKNTKNYSNLTQKNDENHNG